MNIQHDYLTAFNEKDWISSWNHENKLFVQHMSLFAQKPTVQTYQKTLSALSTLFTLQAWQEYSFSFFKGDHVSSRVEQKIQSFSRYFEKNIPFFINFLQKQNNKGKNTSFYSDLLFFQGYTKNHKKLDTAFQIFDSTSRSFYMPRVDGVRQFIHDSELIKKTKRGYKINNRHYYINTILQQQKTNHSRYVFWKKMQHHTFDQKDINPLLMSYNRIAQELGYFSYMDYLYRDSLFSVNDIISIFETYMQKISSFEDIHHKPWNVEQQNSPKEKALCGLEFPIDHIISFIIPDILSWDNWTVSQIHSENDIYCFHLTKDSFQTLFYFAPYPTNIDETSTIKGYTSLLRDNFNGALPVIFVSQNLELNHHQIHDLQEIQYLTHEMGHVLHYLSSLYHQKENTFSLSHKIQLLTGELPGVFMENCVKSPELLLKWTSPQSPKKCQTLAYWKSIIQSRTTLYSSLSETEKALMELKVLSQNSLKNQNLWETNQTMRSQFHLPSLLPQDKSMYRNFEFSSLTGAIHTYIVAEALSFALLPVVTPKYIQQNMLQLLSVLKYPSTQIDSLWEKTYHETILSTLEKGFSAIFQKEIRNKS